jgi:hypothetical protein
VERWTFKNIKPLGFGSDQMLRVTWHYIFSIRLRLSQITPFTEHAASTVCRQLSYIDTIEYLQLQRRGKELAGAETSEETK